MPVLPSTTDSPAELPADLVTTERVKAKLKTGSTIVGGRIRSGAQVFLSEYTIALLLACFLQSSEDALYTDVPYALAVPRWTDPRPIPADYQYPDKEYIYDALYCTQPRKGLPRLGSTCNQPHSQIQI